MAIIQPFTLPDMKTLPRRTEAENIRYGVPGHGIQGTTVRRDADIAVVGALVKLQPGQSFVVPPKCLTATRAWARIAASHLDRAYTIEIVAEGHRVWRVR